ncbi:glycosyltransferase family 4 protein [Flavobacterium sp. DSR3-2]|uniref:glycosyltransferase family 4 protein n=1 Tax=Flavobacterium sp. DSR3-2 TaxID=2804634 RepID=UPI003CF86B56
MKAVFLIIDYVPHQVLTIRKLIEDHDCDILAYHVARFITNIPVLDNFATTHYKNQKKEEILANIISYNPDIIVVAGWMIPEYVWIAKKLMKILKVPIVSYSDTQWYGTIRQRINALISPFHVKKAFTHIWAAGLYQFEYARKLGYSKGNIILNSLTADVDLFNKINLEVKLENYPKNFIYIGNFSLGKGLDVLIKAWDAISDKKDWTLTLIGDGILKDSLRSNKSIIIKDYMNQAELIHEIQNSGCLILPSLKEQWALVIHEAAVSGLPIVCTDICGAAPHFVINGYNGFKVKANDIIEMKQALIKMINMNDNELYVFSCKSRELGLYITPDISINSLLQLI